MNLFKQGQLEVVEKIKQQMEQPQIKKENKTKKVVILKSKYICFDIDYFYMMGVAFCL